MKEVDVVIVSGVATRVVEGMAKALRANSIEPAFIELNPSSIDHYLGDLCFQAWSVIASIRTRAGLQVRSLTIASTFDKDAEIDSEAAYFCPSARRIQLPRALSNNPAAASTIRDTIIRSLKSKSEGEVRKALRADNRNLLPLRNSGCRGLDAEARKIYLQTSVALDRKIEKEVGRIKRTKTLRIRGVDFTPALNSGRHPIRRCTDSPRCDIASSFRFSVPVNERFEFDVSCETGLKGKTFYQCDGTERLVANEPTHLNMRINDDHAAG